MVDTAQQSISTAKSPHDSDFGSWLTSKDLSGNRKIVLSDFDGTLTPKHPIDSDNFSFAESKLATTIGQQLSQEGIATGIVSARSFGEVRRIIEHSLLPAGALSGFSASEHGAVIFCSKLSTEQEALLTANGFRVLDHEKVGAGKYTVISLSLMDSDFIRDNIVKPVIDSMNVPEKHWASSFTHVADREDLNLLKELSRHKELSDTIDSVERFGSGYIKINGWVRSMDLVKELMKKAEEHNVYALYSPPHPEDPDQIHTLDFSPGTDKGIALAAISRAVSILTGEEEKLIPLAYFGDGENDIAAFDYVKQREGYNQAFLVDAPQSQSVSLLERASTAEYLEGYPNIFGVQLGLSKFLSNS